MAAAGALLLVAGDIYLAQSGQEPTVVRPQVREPERQETRPGAAPTTQPAPASVAPEATTPPVAKLPPKARAPIKHIETTRTSSPRCADLLSRIQLGESLSYEAQADFQKECQQ